MALYNDIGILLLAFFAVTLSLQEDVDDCFGYGTCDPGPKCENWNSSTNSLKCYSCSDGGFWPFEFQCDGVVDCYNGMDELDCELDDIQSKVTSCSGIREKCRFHSNCCSGYCHEFRDPRRIIKLCYFKEDRAVSRN